MKKKKILFFIPSLTTGGAEKITVDIYDEFDRDLFTYRLCVATDKLDFLSEIEHKDELLLLKKSRTLKSIFPWFKILAKENPDLIVSVLCDANIIAGISGLIYNIPFILVDHGGLLAFKEKHISSSLVDRLKKKVLNYIHNKARNTIAVSLEIKKVLQTHFSVSEENITIINNSINAKKIKEKAQCKVKFSSFHDYHPRIVSVGRLSKEKGHKYLVKATSYLKHEYPNIGVFIIGEGPERESISGLIAENNLEDNVFLLGRRANPYNYVKNSDVFVLPSLRESFSLAICEAGICQTPVVTTNWEGIEDVYKNLDLKKLLIAKREDSSSLYKRIVKILASKDLRERLTSNLYSFVKRFTDINKVAQNYEDIFKEILR